MGTLFDFASISKPFAAAAVMKLVEDGHLGLDDVVADRLPELGRYGRGLRLRHRSFARRSSARPARPKRP